MAESGNDRHDEDDAPGTDTRRAGRPGRGDEWTEKRARVLSGLVAVVWQSRAELREADPTVERRQPSITMSLLGLGVRRALNPELQIFLYNSLSIIRTSAELANVR